MRKPYLDNIRWATVLLVVVYHACYLYNGVGVLGGIPGGESIAALDAFITLVYPWFMVLLFVVAGMSARYALERRTAKQFLRERAVKLLVPSTLGLFVLQWVTGYLNIKMGGGLDYIPGFLVYPISVLSGVGPLWFIQMLFLFSCLLVLLRKLDRGDRLWTACGRVGPFLVAPLFLVLWGASHILNTPVITVYRFGVYGAAFFIGYCVLSHEEVQKVVAQVRLPMLFAAVISGAAYLLRYYGENYTEDACLQSFATNLYLWVAVLAVLGCGKQYFDRENHFTHWMTQASFGIYILHYPSLMVVAWLLYTYCALPAAGNYLVTLGAGLALTLALYQVLRRIPLLRWLVLGRGKKGEA
jgi:hypothetical protein